MTYFWLTATSILGLLYNSLCEAKWGWGTRIRREHCTLSVLCVLYTVQHRGSPQNGTPNTLERRVLPRPLVCKNKFDVKDLVLPSRVTSAQALPFLSIHVVSLVLISSSQFPYSVLLRMRSIQSSHCIVIRKFLVKAILFCIPFYRVTDVVGPITLWAHCTYRSASWIISDDLKLVPSHQNSVSQESLWLKSNKIKSNQNVFIPRYTGDR